MIFPEEDGPILDYQKEEGLSIEPDYYVPILPLVLVNGAEGIGTGWSTQIPQYNPLDIVDNLKSKLLNKAGNFKRMTPWYRGYTGKIEYNSDNNSYMFTGRYKIADQKLEIFELPIKKWTSDYKNFLL